MNHFAKYYKCALQVNPNSYASYRGIDIQDEDENNKKILETCNEENNKKNG